MAKDHMPVIRLSLQPNLLNYQPPPCLLILNQSRSLDLPSKLHYDRTFPLDACPPNFTPVEDPTFSSFSHEAFSDLILGFPLA
ncbi:hypothetical protein NC652_010719 [Populus alba x Populus x berolinensis]|nr:hypothetical protein NC652_010719 [Populus alba x Populus x berolinensis]